jgi:DNA transposition AAA+ family ATPase
MNDKTLETQKTAEALKAYMERNPELSQAKIAKAVGASDTVISQFLAGKYIGNVEKLQARVREFLKRESERDQHAELRTTFAATSQAEEALSVLSFCHVHRQIGVIHAPAGLGKTVSLRHYAAENSWVKIVNCRAGMSQRDVLDEIAEELGLVVRGTCGKILRTLLAELRGSETILVFDEAQHLTLKHFEMIRYIYDRLATPIVFVGTDDIINRMTGRKNIVYDQVFSRVGMKRRLKPTIKKTDVALLMDKAGVSGERRELVDYLFEIAKRSGYYRTMMHCLYTAQVIAKKKLETLEVSHLQVANQALWDGAA